MPFSFGKTSIVLSLFALGLMTACSGSGDGTTGSGGETSSGGNGGTGATTTNTGGSGGNGGSTGGTGGTGGTANGGSGGTGGSTGGTGGGSNLADKSDDFQGSSLDSSWTIFNPNPVTVTVSGGSLNLVLNQAALWYQANQGVLVYKPITGDFKATARIHTFKTTAPQSPPDQPVELGGLMARSPSSPPEDYVFIVVGHDENDLSVETKSTDNAVSDYVGPSWPNAEAELRLCRVGADFVLLKRAIGAPTWTTAIQYSRPDMPATLQVGPNIYSLNQPDLTVQVDEVTFAPVSGLNDCSQN